MDWPCEPLVSGCVLLGWPGEPLVSGCVLLDGQVNPR